MQYLAALVILVVLLDTCHPHPIIYPPLGPLARARGALMGVTMEPEGPLVIILGVAR